MSRYAVCAMAMLFVWNAAPVLAQNANQDNRVVLPGGITGILEGTPQEQAACANDAHRYCREEIPNTFDVLACLKAEREKISKPCQQVLLTHGQ
jgi:hypothetical protein